MKGGELFIMQDQMEIFQSDQRLRNLMRKVVYLNKFLTRYKSLTLTEHT